MGKLSIKRVAATREPGMYGDGDGLYLRVGPTGAQSWILRTLVHGRRREMGLGSLTWMSLAEAREESRKLRTEARSGRDPDLLRKREELSFEEAAKRHHASLSCTLKSDRHADLWLRSLELYAFPKIGKRPIQSITSADVLATLNPIWAKKHDTARRVKQRIAAVFDSAKGAGHYARENPVAGLKRALPAVKRKAEHMAALPWRELPAFMAQLASREAVSARCLEFLILTALRSGEVRGAQWSEIDVEAATWLVPDARMKRRVPHRVPLSFDTLAVLEKVRGLNPVYVFPSPKHGTNNKTQPLSVMAFKPLLRQMGVDGFTVHGLPLYLPRLVQRERARGSRGGGGGTVTRNGERGRAGLFEVRSF
jgi:integrase